MQRLEGLPLITSEYRQEVLDHDACGFAKRQLSISEHIADIRMQASRRDGGHA